MDAEGGAVISHVLFPGPGCAHGGGVMGGECPARTHWAVVCAEALCQLLGRAPEEFVSLLQLVFRTSHFYFRCSMVRIGSALFYRLSCVPPSNVVLIMSRKMILLIGFQ